MNQKSGSLLKPFYPALDGLRGIAIMMVFALHTIPFFGVNSVIKWGWVGVDLFFVLSGFLITGILYDTLHRPDFFRNFYIRRSLRIFPLFYGFWVGLLILTPLVQAFMHIGWNRYLFTSMAYVGNFFTPGSAAGLNPDPFAIPVITTSHPGVRYIEVIQLWSLCVEEQFYLVWPLVVWLVRSRRTLFKICLAITLLTPLLRWYLYLHTSPALIKGGFLYFSTYTRVDTLLVGAAVALWLRGPGIAPQITRKFYLSLCVIPCALLIFLLSSHLNRWEINQNNPIVVTIGYSFIALSSAGFLLAAIDSSSIVSRTLNIPPLISIGRLSYGIYFLHNVPIQIAGGRSLRLADRHLGFLFLPIAIGLSYGAAWLSFRYFESPFLRLKDRLAPKPGISLDPPPAAIAFPSAAAVL